MKVNGWSFPGKEATSRFTDSVPGCCCSPPPPFSHRQDKIDDVESYFSSTWTFCEVGASASVCLLYSDV